MSYLSAQHGLELVNPPSQIACSWTRSGPGLERRNYEQTTSVCVGGCSLLSRGFAFQVL